MQKKTFRFSQAATDFYFDGSFAKLQLLAPKATSVIITDENVFAAHEKKFKGWNTIVLKAGEAFKIQATVDAVIDQLIDMQADRGTTIVGVGGGVVTDLAGYVAAIYMRGLRFGFVPTTLLAMVDASIGGKNGIDVDVFKNLVGTIRQPAFILHDLSLLKTLPEAEWQNGFAEIIKHAAIGNSRLFAELEENTLAAYRRKKPLLAALVQKNAVQKIKLVQLDEFESGDRKLLNFGHTIGHALETQYELSHGQAISIGMTYAAALSEKLLGMKGASRVPRLLAQYGLPTHAKVDARRVMEVLKMDKKKKDKRVQYILLQKIGRAVVHPIDFEQLNAEIEW